MLNILHDIMEVLPYLMEDKSKWRSLNITYAKPHVERIWRQHGDYRILLHRIYPCTKGEALYHAHPWPSAVRIINGKYEMGVSDTYSSTHFSNTLNGDSRGQEYIKTIMTAGSEYEMNNRYGWHYVRPVDGPSDSIMITGKPFSSRVNDRGSIPQEKQKQLTPPRFDQLFNEWKKMVSKPSLDIVKDLLVQKIKYMGIPEPSDEEVENILTEWEGQ